ncbi:MAG TPA: PIN domain-containing protein [Candidatus Dormibacteraeota bacterium]|nr:PIN domain-containing protein [Candidatus Dormibacteraeota bacterium]
MVLRAVFGLLFGIVGFLIGREAYVNVFSIHFTSQWTQVALLVLAPVAGAVVGVLVAPLAQSLFEEQLAAFEEAIERLAPSEIAGGAIGLIAGLVIAFLIKSVVVEFVTVGGRTGTYLAIAVYLLVAIFTSYLGARVGAKMRILPVPLAAATGSPLAKVVDTSVIVDGRIVDIAGSGFLEGTLIVPRFVLRELQAIADSNDPLKRTRGRRGLEVLGRLQELSAIEIGERDYDDMPPGSVDAKLVRFAREIGARLLTNDYNLNRVAQLEGVAVLNVNELANAVRAAVLPGEELRATVIKEGKEPHQGVAYLDDGTMIVVEHGRHLLGESVNVIVTSVLQTVAGRMIFARPKKE